MIPRRHVAAAVLLPILAACSGADRLSRNGSGGVVSAATPEAVAAGVEILNRGGNAIDAAVAVALSLGVTEPAGSGIGGQAFIMVHHPGEKPIVIRGTSFAPGALPAKVTDDDLEGRRASTVPSMVRVLDTAHKKYGSGNVAWADLVAPASRHASEGFALGHFRRASVARYASALREDPHTAAIFLDPGGKVPSLGTIIRQPALAATLERLAEHGAADFYSGGIAKMIAEDMKQNGGWITLDDLKNVPEPEIVAPLRSTYRGWDVYSLPPPAGGWVVIQALNLADEAPAGELAYGHPNRQVWMAEILRSVHRNRLEAPVANLVDYARAVDKKISKERAREILREFPRPGSGETTHFSVVDRNGTVVCVTASLNAYFGCKRLSPKLGILYNDYMKEFVTDNPGHPFALKPGAMPYSSMSGTILAKGGVPHLGVGSPGSRRIISAVIQTTVNWVDGGPDIGRAVAEPRIHVVPEEDDLMFEKRPGSRRVLLDMERRGFRLAVPLSSLHQENANPYFGGVHAVALERGGRWNGAADPRRDGRVGRAAPGLDKSLDTVGRATR